MGFGNIKNRRFGSPGVEKASDKVAVSGKDVARVAQENQEAILYQASGKYARQQVLAVFEMIGGTDRMAEWAENNLDDYYTKIFTKTITKEVEQKNIDTVDDWLLEAIEADYEVVE